MCVKGRRVCVCNEGREGGYVYAMRERKGYMCSKGREGGYVYAVGERKVGMCVYSEGGYVCREGGGFVMCCLVIWVCYCYWVLILLWLGLTSHPLLFM